MNEALLQELLDAGCPPMLVVKVGGELARLAEQAASLERRRSADRERSQRRRDAEHNVNHVTSRDVADAADAPPSLDKETSPRPLKEINLTPRATCAGALARKAGGFGPPEGVTLHTWNVFCGQRKKPITKIAYDRMLVTIAEAFDVGWPPGELVERSIEKGWETLFTPTERRNGKRPANDFGKRDRPGEMALAKRTLGFGGGLLEPEILPAVARSHPR